ncbi:scoloptoxin SSD14-like [Haemaphysalis longicornis]
MAYAYDRYRFRLPPRQPRFVSSTIMGHYRGWAAVTGAKQCTNVTRKIFDRNGTVGDATVATLLCVCVALPHYCGLGGGFVGMYYNRKTQSATSLMARTRAPLAAKKEMFGKNPNASLVGALAVGVFGELKGYELILNVTGSRVPWKDLFDDAIDLAENGIEINAIMGAKLSALLTYGDNKLSKHLTNRKTSRFFETGDIYTNKELAETMRRIAQSEQRGRYFDSGEDIEAIVRELKAGGGIITEQDFESFKPEAAKPVTVELKTGERLFTTPPPASGAVLAFVVKVMDTFRSDGRLDDSEENLHRIVEAIKFGFGRRTDIGDPDEPETKYSVNKALDELVNPKIAARVARNKITDKSHETSYYGPENRDNDDHGTGIISVVAPNGDVICIASTINTV